MAEASAVVTADAGQRIAANADSSSNSLVGLFQWGQPPAGFGTVQGQTTLVLPTGGLYVVSARLLFRAHLEPAASFPAYARAKLVIPGGSAS